MAYIAHGNRAWERLSVIIKESGLSVHAFAKHIGMQRSETLYQIKRGQIGISRTVAQSVVDCFPEYSAMWLQSGMGTMYANPTAERGYIPCYNLPLSQISEISGVEADDYLYIPMISDADFAIRHISDDMQPKVLNGALLILKSTNVKSIIFGEMYVVRTADFTLLRVVRSAGEDDCLRLVALKEGYDDMIIQRSDVLELYSVLAMLNLNN
ncbi:MAG: helix-turn-helix transcriptional regulator [Rikenellaceae bacterium]|nr:helix-turn-helix transcriptional regulator [Rikenellaceae bacterium]